MNVLAQVFNKPTCTTNNSSNMNNRSNSDDDDNDDFNKVLVMVQALMFVRDTCFSSSNLKGRWPVHRDQSARFYSDASQAA